MKTLLLTLIGTLALCAAGTDAAAEKQVTAAMEAMKQAMIHRDGAALAKLMLRLPERIGIVRKSPGAKPASTAADSPAPSAPNTSASPPR